MHPQILAQRNAQALNRMTAAVETLAQRTGVPVPNLKHGNVHDPQAAALFQRESIAAFLEALVAGGETVSPVEIQSATEDRTVAELVPAIAEMDVDALNELEAAEQAGKNRKGVLSAIDERREALAAEPDREPDQGTGEETE
jgi:hypothetical protein